MGSGTRLSVNTVMTHTVEQVHQLAATWKCSQDEHWVIIQYISAYMYFNYRKTQFIL